MFAMLTPQQKHESRCFRTGIPIGSIREPGCYVCEQTGRLIRVFQDEVKEESPPITDVTGAEPSLATKISDNPYIRVSEARFLAANGNLEVDF